MYKCRSRVYKLFVYPIRRCVYHSHYPSLPQSSISPDWDLNIYFSAWKISVSGLAALVAAIGICLVSRRRRQSRPCSKPIRKLRLSDESLTIFSIPSHEVEDLSALSLEDLPKRDWGKFSLSIYDYSSYYAYVWLRTCHVTCTIS